MLITPTQPYWQPALAGGAAAISPVTINAAPRPAVKAVIRRGDMILNAVIAIPLWTTAPQSLPGVGRDASFTFGRERDASFTFGAVQGNHSGARKPTGPDAMHNASVVVLARTAIASPAPGNRT